MIMYVNICKDKAINTKRLNYKIMSKNTNTWIEFFIYLLLLVISSDHTDGNKKYYRGYTYRSNIKT